MGQGTTGMSPRTNSQPGAGWLRAWRARRNRTTAAPQRPPPRGSYPDGPAAPAVAAEAGIPAKILTAAANAALATAIKKGLEHPLQYALRSCPNSPRGLVYPAPRQPDRLGRTVSPGV